jgi:hypothetical protein
MFDIYWLQTALEELARIWVQSDSGLRQAIITSVHAIDQVLQANPECIEYVFYVYPLGIVFEINDHGGFIRVLHVWDIRRSK